MWLRVEVTIASGGLLIEHHRHRLPLRSGR